MRNKVLIIEDQQQIQNTLVKIFKNAGLEPISAFTVTEAQKAFFQHLREIQLIIVDGNLERERDTLPLVTKFRPLFDGVIVAISANPEINQELISRGCDLSGTKPHILEPIMQALKK